MVRPAEKTCPGVEPFPPDATSLRKGCITRGDEVCAETSIPVSTGPQKTSSPAPAAPSAVAGWGPLLPALVALAGVLALFWQDLAHLAHRWWNEADYGHGFLVPIFSAWLLYRNRERFPADARVSPSAFIAGVVLLLLVGVGRFVSSYHSIRLLAPYTLIPALMGVALLTRGWRVLWWALPSIAFLFFMVPLPGSFGTMLRGPLQRVATIASTYCLQTVGIPAVSVGNVIHLTEGRIGVVEACSGLRMLMVFFTLTTGYVFVSRHPLPLKVVVVGSALPIAVVANIFRIVITGMAHEWMSPEFADRVFHDFAGLLMVPAGLVLLLGVLAFLNRVAVVSEGTPGPVLIGPNSPKSQASPRTLDRAGG